MLDFERISKYMYTVIIFGPLCVYNNSTLTYREVTLFKVIGYFKWYVYEIIWFFIHVLCTLYGDISVLV